MYARVSPDTILTQGDLIEGCPLVSFKVGDGPLNLTNPAIAWWPARVVVLTQACDLAQPKTGVVLVAQVHDAQKLVESGTLKAATIRDQIRRHQVFGWYFLPGASEPVVVTEALVDLRDVHSVPRAVLEQLIVDGKRVATLQSPYREHLAQHFAVTYMRIALPEPYGTKP